MNVTITGRGSKITEPIRQKIEEMLSKHERFIENATKIEVELTQLTSSSKAAGDHRIEITISMPQAIVRVEDGGKDFYTIVDKIDPTLRRRLVRYHENKKMWENRKSWRMVEKERFEEELEQIGEDVYADPTDTPPVITRYKQFSQNSPMHPAEAIERMELLGHEAFLFKNIESDRYAMVYKKLDGTYGLVEPKDV